MKISQEKPAQKLINEIFQKTVNNFKYEDGVKQIESILKRNPNLYNNERVLYNLGFLYDHIAFHEKMVKKRKLYEKRALQLYKRGLKFNPQSTDLTWGIGRVWWHRNSKRALPHALKAYKLAKKYLSDGGGFAQNVANIYLMLGDFKRAEHWYLRALKEERHKSFGSYGNVIMFYKKTNQIKKAQLYAKKMQELYAHAPAKLKNSPSGKWFAQIFESVLNQ